MSNATARLTSAGILAVVRAPDEQSALHGVDALVGGGISGIEITYSTPNAAEVIATLQQRYGDDIYLGAGTVTTPAQAREAANAGASFLVSPGTDPHLTQAMLATGRSVFTGALTPSEVMAAQQLGSHAVKIFPASIGGPDYLRALRAPFPDAFLMPTGGVTTDNLGLWFAAGARAVGVGGELVSAADLAAGRFAAVGSKATAFRQALDSVRASREKDGQTIEMADTLG